MPRSRIDHGTGSHQSEIPACAGPVWSTEFWDQAWDEFRNASLLRSSQNIHPERWSNFYERVAHIWPRLDGNASDVSASVIETLLANGVIGPDRSVLDLGCGPGTLSIPMAEVGCHVTALDNSLAMIEQLRARSRLKKALQINEEHRDWLSFAPPNSFDVVLAGCFPDVLNSSGLRRMESWCRSFCVLVLGAGEETFPLRGILWRRLIGTPIVSPARNVMFAINHLLAAGKRPSLRHVAQPVRLRLEQELALAFYTEYFAMFDVPATDTRKAMLEDLDGYLRDGMYLADGVTHQAVIWWPTHIDHGYGESK